MDKIWCNRILARTRKIEEVPEMRRASVELELKRRLDEGIINLDDYNLAMNINTSESSDTAESNTDEVNADEVNTDEIVITE